MALQLGRSCELEVTEGACSHADIVGLAERESMHQNHTCHLSPVKENRWGRVGRRVRGITKVWDVRFGKYLRKVTLSNLRLAHAERKAEGWKAMCLGSHSGRSRADYCSRHLSQRSFYCGIDSPTPTCPPASCNILRILGLRSCCVPSLQVHKEIYPVL